MIPNTVMFPEGSQPLWFKVYADEEVRTLMRMSNDERGLFTSLRWYAITCENFSGDPEEMWQDVKNFCGISRYKFKKLLPRVLKFFTNTDAGFCFQRDEDRVEESRSRVTKLREYGRLGGLSKSESARKVTPIAAQQSLAELDREPLADRVANQPPEGVDKREEIPPPPTNVRELGALAESVGGGGGSPSESQTEGDGYGEFVKHCGFNGLSAGSKELWRRLRAKFPGRSVAEVLRNLPKFDGQETAGLWDHHCAEVLSEESRSQPKRKPATKKTQRELALEQAMVGL